MITLPTGTKIWIIAGITDMRCGFNGLAAYFHERRSPNNIHRDRVITFRQIAE
ncbi:transposase [Salmonella enterica]|nr:transposase [Salmonella enterica]